jgi:hypothetical protein
MWEPAFVVLCLTLAAALLLFGAGVWTLGTRWGGRLLRWLERWLQRVESRRRDF